MKLAELKPQPQGRGGLLGTVTTPIMPNPYLPGGLFHNPLGGAYYAGGGNVHVMNTA